MKLLLQAVNLFILAPLVGYQAGRIARRISDRRAEK